MWLLIASQYLVDALVSSVLHQPRLIGNAATRQCKSICLSYSAAWWMEPAFGGVVAENLSDIVLIVSGMAPGFWQLVVQAWHWDTVCP